VQEKQVKKRKISKGEGIKTGKECGRRRQDIWCGREIGEANSETEGLSGYCGEQQGQRLGLENLHWGEAVTQKGVMNLITNNSDKN